MNRNLQDLVINFATLSHKEVVNSLHDSSKDTAIAMLMDLMAHYFNDKNSSSLREMVIVTLSGYEMTGTKIGYNGYRQDSITGKTIHCEAKPKNINTNDEKPKKLNGGANFTDYTWERFARDKKNNPKMIMGGFVDGKLIYTFEFPFKTSSFLKRLDDRLEKRFPKREDISGEYLRSADFRLSDYQDALNKNSVNIFISKSELLDLKPHFTRPLYTLLEGFINE